MYLTREVADQASYIQSMSEVCFVLSPLDLAQSGADLNARLSGWNVYGKFGTMCGGDLAGSAELSR